MAHRCFYCGAAPARKRTHYYGNAKQYKSVYIYNGIDRVKNNIGYEPNNVVPCCFQCNHAKLDYSAAEFKSWAKRVALNLMLWEQRTFNSTYEDPPFF